MQPVCYQLIGVPASGKSTWVNAQTLIEDYTYVSTDFWVEQYAKTVDMTYTEVFDVAMPYAIEQMLEQVKLSHKYNANIIWDQTSTTIASRAKKFKMLPNYEHIAVVFSTPDRAELDRRLASRPGKVVPVEIVDSMIARFEMPTLAEGYKEIIIVK
jgi:predicted kinase